MLFLFEFLVEHNSCLRYLKVRRGHCMEIKSGMSDAGRKKIADELRHFLGDSYAVYLKTQNFHWNVKGPYFFTLHLLFEKHYEEMASAIDEIAERIAALGYYVD